MAERRSATHKRVSSRCEPPLLAAVADLPHRLLHRGARFAGLPCLVPDLIVLAAGNTRAVLLAARLHAHSDVANEPQRRAPLHVIEAVMSHIYRMVARE